MTILQCLGDSLLGDGWTSEPVLAQALRVDDVLPRLHCHVLAHLAGVASRQLEKIPLKLSLITVEQGKTK